MIPHCPHCDSHKLNRWGITKQGIQRFKSKSYNKIFNAFTDSPPYQMKKVDELIDYMKITWRRYIPEKIS